MPLLNLWVLRVALTGKGKAGQVKARGGIRRVFAGVFSSFEGGWGGRLGRVGSESGLILVWMCGWVGFLGARM
jgi:hypothetical protein